MRVDTLLTDLLRATADKAAAGRRVDLLRDRLDTEARRRYADEGAAPSWKAPALGTVRLDPKPARAYVEDADAFGSYVAQRFPAEVDAVLRISATDLEAAVDALQFAGITSNARVEVRPAFAEALLGNAEVLYDASTTPPTKAVGRVVDADAGTLELIDGAGVVPPSATLVVSLDRTAKARVLAGVEEQLEREEADEVSLGEPVPLVDGTGERIDPADEEAVTAQEAHAADVGARLIASATAPLLDPTTAVEVDTTPTPGSRPVDAPPYTARPGFAFAPSPGDPGYSLGAPLTPTGTGPELLGGSAAAPEASSSDGDPTTALAVLPTDDLKRAARRHRLPISGTKVLLAARLHKAGLTADAVVALRPSEA